MEEVLIQRLSVLTRKLEEFSTKALEVIRKEDYQFTEAVVIQNQLEAIIERLTSELHNYFRISTEPSADDISSFTDIQLKGEEILVELKTRLDLKRNNSQPNIESNNVVTSKLPKLSLPEFSGDILRWQEFWDHFSSNIDNRSLPEVDKLLYLKASLVGEAKQLIEGLETTHKNYKIALNILKDRYGKENQIIDAHYAALYKIKPAINSSEDCRRTLNEIERHLRVLNSLGQDSNHQHLRFIIMEKFPAEIIYEIKRAPNTDSVSDMRQQLEIIISAKEESRKLNNSNEQFTTETLHITQRKNLNSSLNKQIYERNKYTPVTTKNENLNRRNYEYRKENNQNIERPRKFRKHSCIFCKGDHFNDKCKKYKTILEKKKYLKNRCYKCLWIGHNATSCKKMLTCAHCRDPQHNRALCPTKFPNETVLSVTNHKETTILQTAIVTAKADETNTRQENCRILLDSGSQRTYICKSLAKKLCLPIIEENSLSIFTFGKETPQQIESPLVKLKLKTRTNEDVIIYANCVESITNGVLYHKLDQKDINKDFIMADDGTQDEKVHILIGNDYYFSLIYDGKKRIGENLYLINSKFGWIMSGQMNIRQMKQEELSILTYFQTGVNIGLIEPDQPLDFGNVKNLWELEAIGITDSPKVTREETAIQTFNETTKYVNGRYTVNWPWKEYPPQLTTNFGLAYGRLTNLLKRLDSDMLYSYDQTIQQQIENGIIECVDNTIETTKVIHYLPHHGVQQAGKAVRIVYDASARTKGSKSLNESLYCGPLLLEDLTGLIIKFREHKIGLIADIEKAFLQIALHKNDRDVTRFLWLKDVNRPATPNNLIHLRFCRVPFGIISSPFLLNATIKHHLARGNKKHIKNLAENIYVDNLVTGSNSTSEAIEIYKDAKDTFEEISMNLRSWSSNDIEFMKQINDICEDEIVKVLGLNWNILGDTLQLKFKNINTNISTKRGVLKVIATVYDPCGYAAPYLLSAKLFLQELWKSNIKWDKTLPPEMIELWSQQICIDLNQIKSISLPRHYISNVKQNRYTIHCFCDASLKAYAAVIYIVQDKKKNFIMGKSRLVPLKDQDSLKIPRLELLAVLIGCRLLKFVRRYLQSKIIETFLWTDSQIVIEWINSEKLLPPFITKRIQEIRELKDIVVKYVPSHLNPADVATKTNISMEDKKRWLIGPEFLTEEPETWPVSTESGRVEVFVVGEGLPNTDVTKDNTENIQIKEIFSNKLEEIKQIQYKYFTQEVKGKRTDLSRNLKLFKDKDEILRCEGRMGNADWSFDKRYPILIPRECDFTNNLIIKTHNDNYHVGANHTLSIIRNTYWIPKGKAHVQKILKQCSKCTKHCGGPFKAPPVPALPHIRVNYSSPFSFTGVDIMGPLLVDNGKGPVKRWICLYTCLAVRAIHLEIVQDLTADEGILALRRMISSRGVPVLITSDNALYFKLMAEILENQYCIKNEIKWKFIPQLAPWFGGFYERLVGIVKNCLKRTLQKHLLKDKQLETVIKEIEAVVNTRPLTHVDSELDQILKPSDFLTMGKCLSTEASEDNTVIGTVTKTDLIKSWKRALIILQEFKDMFINRYLASLRERYQHAHKEPRITSKLKPDIGQVVQIKGETSNRQNWKVGRISSLIKGADGMVRVAKVKVGNKEFTRSISHLYPLEIEDEEEKQSYFTSESVNNEQTPDLEPSTTTFTPRDSLTIDENFDTSTPHTNSTPTTNYNGNIQYQPEIENNEEIQNDTVDDNETRPKRDAAIKALDKIREWTRNLLSLL